MNSSTQFHMKSHENVKNIDNRQKFSNDHLVQPPYFTGVETENERNGEQLRVAQEMLEVALRTLGPATWTHALSPSCASSLM